MSPLRVRAPVARLTRKERIIRIVAVVLAASFLAGAALSLFYATG